VAYAELPKGIAREFYFSCGRWRGIRDDFRTTVLASAA
jgi:hypothetical protein